MRKITVFAVARDSELELITVAQEIEIGVQCVIEDWQVSADITMKTSHQYV
ncbi:MAG: hypothetical protein ACJ71J_15785 [Nitrososphaeraceae archaeon]